MSRIFSFAAGLLLGILFPLLGASPVVWLMDVANNGVSGHRLEVSLLVGIGVATFLAQLGSQATRIVRMRYVRIDWAEIQRDGLWTLFGVMTGVLAAWGLHASGLVGFTLQGWWLVVLAMFVIGLLAVELRRRTTGNSVEYFPIGPGAVKRRRRTPEIWSLLMYPLSVAALSYVVFQGLIVPLVTPVEGFEELAKRLGNAAPVVSGAILLGSNVVAAMCLALIGRTVSRSPRPWVRTYFVACIVVLLTVAAVTLTLVVLAATDVITDLNWQITITTLTTHLAGGIAGMWGLRHGVQPSHNRTLLTN